VSWSAVGSPIIGDFSTSGATVTISVDPVNVGDILEIVLTPYAGVYDGGITSVSGGGVTTWVEVGSQGTGDYNNVWLYRGVVTSTGSSTLTVGVSSEFGGAWLFWIIQEFGFSSGGPFSDIVTGSSTSSSSGNYPSLVAAANNELFVGAASNAASGGTSGYTYITGSDGGGYYAGPVNNMVYFLNTTAGTTYNPAWTSGGGFAESALISSFVVPPSSGPQHMVRIL